MALVKALPQSPGPIRLLVGRDTRESGEWIERELAPGRRRRGAQWCRRRGVIPTPAVAYLTRAGAWAGVVISASHNPFHDNGIKVFSGAARSSARHRRCASRPSWRTRRGRNPRADAPSSRWMGWPPVACPPRNASARAVPCHADRMALDLANGATYQAARRLLRGLGFAVMSMGARLTAAISTSVWVHPSGSACRRGRRGGVPTWASRSMATATARSSSIVRARRRRGCRLADAARADTGRRAPTGNTVVATVMSNSAWRWRCGDRGHRAGARPVGDKYVMEELLTATSSAVNSRVT